MEYREAAADILARYQRGEIDAAEADRLWLALRPARPASRRASAPGLADVRSVACRTCEEFNGAACELRFPDGCCLARWTAWVGSPASACPAQPPKWLPAPVAE